MNYKFFIKPQAAQEIEEATEYYENQKQGLGMDFLEDFEHISHLLVRNPMMYMRIFWHFRRALMSRFPYAIYYTVHEEAQEIEVIAVIHQNQDPDIIRKKLRL